MKSSILIVDDDTEFLNACAIAMQMAGYECTISQSGKDAHEKIQHRLYDGIVCDVFIPFNGIREGGLILAKEFSSKHPSSCIILVSQYVAHRWVNEFAGLPNLAFVEKGESAIEDLVYEVGRIAKTKFAFVCVPFALEYNDFYEVGIKPVITDCGYKCVRANEIEHNKGILNIIYEQIESSHIVIADMTGSNPNIYYEVGYAHALGKEVILLIQQTDDLPFDLRSFNHIVYNGQITLLKEKLSKRLNGLLNNPC